ncbi:hypothetical protein T552_04110 [Pneumocystis carinii B80]|uniref:Uncharacterized protein n=1 Tax=Pneumocystis carinii (strain B80) TaxID=1408658 RepID=A0A0W4ZLX9_PNEC8|nr:hypothetical protein T552_04110 [Pneumocystis carinii B80]KTW29388.1 hypothetical protein T552_04110 [Pneumocystis carinii B80]
MILYQKLVNKAVSCKMKNIISIISYNKLISNKYIKSEYLKYLNNLDNKNTQVPYFTTHYMYNEYCVYFFKNKNISSKIKKKYSYDHII